VQSDILDRNQAANVHVYVVWFKMLAGDSRQRWDAAVISDPRAVHLWDQNRAAGQWFATNVDQTGYIAWDVYYLYGPDARWDGRPGPLVSSGSTIIGHVGKLKNDFARVTAAG
jgi:hypothetical protein